LLSCASLICLLCSLIWIWMDRPLCPAAFIWDLVYTRC
jgi:hypothetical protein